MRTLTVNEIEDVGGGPAIVLAPAVIKCIKAAAAIFTAAVLVGAGEEIGSQAVKKVTGTCG